jgi:hypothetical protein
LQEAERAAVEAYNVHSTGSAYPNALGIVHAVRAALRTYMAARQP